MPDINRHFIRIHPADAHDPQPDEVADHGLLQLQNQPPGSLTAFPSKDVVDAGFLQLVRYGVRKPGQALIEAGVCHTCECALIGGAIDYLPEPLEPPAEGNVLICCSRPRGDIEIDL